MYRLPLTTMNLKEIILYEDNDALRSTLTAIFSFSKDYKLVGAYFNPSNIIEDLRPFQVEAIIMDINMPIMNGIEAVRLIRSKAIQTPVIMLTVFDDDDNVYNALCAGANGYILKSDIEKIHQAIHEVISGGAPLTGSVAKKILENIRSPFTKKLKEQNTDLTPKELEILESLARGNSYKMVGNELNIAIDTVRSHIRNIYKKLHVNSALEAINKIKS